MATTMGAVARSGLRIAAMIERYLYLLRSSWTRVADLVYWPTVQMLTWGFLQSYLARLPSAGAPSRLAVGAGSLLGAVMLWDVLFRGQLGFSITFLEEMWSRNIGNLMMSPLKPFEFILSLVAMSLVRLAIGIVPMTLLAIWFFGFNVWGLGLALVAFFANLVFTSWAVGLVVSGLVLRNGMGAESLSWTIMFLMLPLTCVYYPVAVLPGWLQAVAWCLPPTYVFEGLRALVIGHEFRADLMGGALLINALLFAVAAAIYAVLLNGARRAGSLLQTGE